MGRPAWTTILVLMTAALAGGCALPTVDEILDGYAQEMPAWAGEPDACAADHVPPRDRPITYLGDRCLDRPRSCIRECEQGDANACYALALALQQRYPEEPPVIQALFLRSCELGVVSGCTNHAAGKSDEHGECKARTFAATCAADDPWGCAMHGLCLHEGLGVERDVAAARRAFERSCELDQEDPACHHALMALARIDAEAVRDGAAADGP
ncbi:MAG: hypothetical protein AAF533_20890 [Acidobacteriota bacterium]